MRIRDYERQFNREIKLKQNPANYHQVSKLSFSISLTGIVINEDYSLILLRLLHLKSPCYIKAQAKVAISNITLGLGYESPFSKAPGIGKN